MSWGVWLPGWSHRMRDPYAHEVTYETRTANSTEELPLTEADVRRIAAEVYREMEGKGRADQA